MTTLPSFLTSVTGWGAPVCPRPLTFTLWVQVHTANELAYRTQAQLTPLVATYSHRVQAWSKKIQLRLHRWSLDLTTKFRKNNGFVNFHTPTVPGIVLYLHHFIVDPYLVKTFNQRTHSQSRLNFSTGRCGFKREQKRAPLARDTMVRAAAWFAKRAVRFVRFGYRLRYKGLTKAYRTLEGYKRFGLGRLRPLIHSIVDVTPVPFGGTRQASHGRKRLRYHRHMYRFTRRRFLRQGDTLYLSRPRRHVPNSGYRPRPQPRFEVGLRPLPTAALPRLPRPMRLPRRWLRDPQQLARQGRQVYDRARTQLAQATARLFYTLPLTPARSRTLTAVSRLQAYMLRGRQAQAAALASVLTGQPVAFGIRRRARFQLTPLSRLQRWTPKVHRAQLRLVRRRFHRRRVASALTGAIQRPLVSQSTRLKRWQRRRARRLRLQRRALRRALPSATPKTVRRPQLQRSVRQRA